MALAGTKTSGTALNPPAAEEVRPAPKSASFVTSVSRALTSFWQTLKPFGWQGLLLVGVLAVLYAPVVRLLVYQWYSDADYSHGFLVPVLSAYLIWQRRDSLRLIPRRPSPWGMVIVLFSLGMLFLGSLGAELSLARHLHGGYLMRTDCVFLEWMLRAMAFPIAFLFFAIPIPSSSITRLFSAPVYRLPVCDPTLEMLNMFPIMREGNVLICRTCVGSGGGMQWYPFPDVVACLGRRLWLSCGTQLTVRWILLLA